MANTYVSKINGYLLKDKEVREQLSSTYATKNYVDSKIPAAFTVDSFLSSTSTNPVQNKVINSALAGKAASSHTQSASTITGGYLNTHPENSPVVIPYIYNDLAFITKKGGSYSIYTTTSTDFTANSLAVGSISVSNPDGMFEPTPSYTHLFTAGEFTVVIDITLHKSLAYSNQFYIDFGTAGFRAKAISVYAKDSSNDSKYVLKGSTTNNASSAWTLLMSHTSIDSDGGTVYGFNKMRVVLKSWNNTTATYQKRITQIGLINYDSAGVAETYVSRGGSTMYGDLNTKSVYPTATNASNLGSSSKQYNAIYGKTIYENGIALSSKYATPTFVDGKFEALEDAIPTKTSQLTNDSGFATETYVNNKVAGIVDSSPEALNTLNELAAALGDNPNFSTDVLNLIGQKASQADLDDLSGDVENLTTEVGKKANASAIPTKTSQLANDSGFKTTDNNTTYSLSKSGSTITLTGSDGSTSSVIDSNSTSYLPLSGGNMTGVINYAGATQQVLAFAPTDTTWRGGLKYSWSSNTTIGLWGKHKMSQFVWHAGTDFASADVNGTTVKNYDFQIGRDAQTGAPIVRTTGSFSEGGTLLSDKYVTNEKLEQVLGSYVNDIDALLGG